MAERGWRSGTDGAQMYCGTEDGALLITAGSLVLSVKANQSNRQLVPSWAVSPTPERIPAGHGALATTVDAPGPSSAAPHHKLSY